MGEQTPPDKTQIEQTIALLERFVENPGLLAHVAPDQLARMMKAAGHVSRPSQRDRKEVWRARRERRNIEAKAQRDADRNRLEGTGIRKQSQRPVFPTPLPELAGGGTSNTLPDPDAKAPKRARLDRAQHCYVCKQDFTTIHHFYDALCPTCAEVNWEKRHQTADLSGRTALLTGGRVKIGFQTGIKLLRAGAHLIVTTRFPRDAARRYAELPDFPEWRDRLEIHGLDLRATPAVERFCLALREHTPQLDYLVSNACQTVRRPAGFYGHLLPTETAPLQQLPESERHLLARHAPRDGEHAAALARAREVGDHDPVALSQVPLLADDLVKDESIFPTGQLDADEQQVDKRTHNSWRMTLDEVSTVEFLEVVLINAIAPGVLTARLRPLLAGVTTNDAHVVNVSAMEGQFYRMTKTNKHPHTNMAKAALNMMTRTSASDYIKDGIHMNSVDTGWITDEDPLHITERKREEHDFHPPLDHVDAAARILDPIFHGQNTGQHQWGLFLKDYMATHW